MSRKSELWKATHMSKAKISYYIKHSSALKAIYVGCGSLLLRFVGLFVKQDSNLILFVSNIGKSFSGSPYALYEYICAHSEYSQYHCIWAFNEPKKYSEHNLDTVRFDSIEYFITALKAKYWITDVNIERSLKFKKNSTVYLNTWHGVALKKIGNDDKNSGRYDYSNLDYLCVSGEHDKRVYTSALKASKNCFLECGMPRNDELFLANAEKKQRIRKKLGIPDGKKVILYAPTWRDSINNGVSFDLKIPVNFKRWEEELGEEYILFFRAHDRTTRVMDIEFNEFIQNYSNYEPLTDLLIVCDVLITDYSSIVFDYSILEKPFICFGYDYDRYCQERGVYFDARKEYPQGVLLDENEVLHRIHSLDIDKECEKTRIIREKFMEYSKGNATALCIRKLFEK